jgi:hypothetical protein
MPRASTPKSALSVARGGALSGERVRGRASLSIRGVDAGKGWSVPNGNPDFSGSPRGRTERKRKRQPHLGQRATSALGGILLSLMLRVCSHCGQRIIIFRFYLLANPFKSGSP